MEVFIKSSLLHIRVTSGRMESWDSSFHLNQQDKDLCSYSLLVHWQQHLFQLKEMTELEQEEEQLTL